ncbi:hypothetical protein [Burkholderia ubonensis]|nr:hypothetical protein [Burkholderia ubonensis]
MELVGVFLVYASAILVGVLAYYFAGKQSTRNQPENSNDATDQ